MTSDGVRLDVKLERDTLWLTHKQMAELFETERIVITKHLTNIFTSRELDRESNVQIMHIAGSDRPVASAQLLDSGSHGRGQLFQGRLPQTLFSCLHLGKGCLGDAHPLGDLLLS